MNYCTRSSIPRESRFLDGAMAIVDLIGTHENFEIITARIKPCRLSSLFYVAGMLTLFVSEVLHNLSTTVFMVSLVKKLPHIGNEQMFIVDIVIVAANAGGAWHRAVR